MPEAIVIYDPQSKQLSFANAELHKLVSKFGGPRCIEESKRPFTDRGMMEHTQTNLESRRDLLVDQEAGKVQTNVNRNVDDELEQDKEEMVQLTYLFSDIMVLPHENETSFSSESPSEAPD